MQLASQFPRRALLAVTGLSPQIVTETLYALAVARFDINVKIDPIEQGRTDRYPLNELDAVFVHRNRMLIIECKTGAQLGDDSKSQNILNRLEVLGEHAAGRFAEKLLLTTENSIDAKTAERVRQYRVRVIKAGELPDFKQTLLAWMRP